MIGKKIYIEEYARTQIKSEEQHMLSVQKMLRDYE